MYIIFLMLKFLRNRVGEIIKMFKNIFKININYNKYFFNYFNIFYVFIVFKMN